MQSVTTQADHYTMTNRLKRRVGQPGGKVWSIYNRGPAPIHVKGQQFAGEEVLTRFLAPNNIMSFETQPVVQCLIDEGHKSANFSVVTYF